MHPTGRPPSPQASSFYIHNLLCAEMNFRMNLKANSEHWARDWRKPLALAQVNPAGIIHLRGMHGFAHTTPCTLPFSVLPIGCRVPRRSSEPVSVIRLLPSCVRARGPHGGAESSPSLPERREVGPLRDSAACRARVWAAPAPPPRHSTVPLTPNARATPVTQASETRGISNQFIRPSG